MAKKIDVWTHNFARSERVRDAVKQIIIPKIKAVRDQRTVLETDWKRFHSMWNVTKDDAHTYSGRANLYVPEVRKNVESQARQMTEAAFPSDDAFSVSPGEGGSKKGAAIQKSIRVWQMDQAQLRIKYHVFARQEALYGTSPVYVCWNRKVEQAFRHARDPKTGKITLKRSMVELFNGPDFMVRDLFKWYALNPFNPDITEDGCVEYVPLNEFDLIEREKAGLLYGLKEIMQGRSEASQMEELQRDVERAEELGISIDAGQGYSGAASLDPDRDGDGNGGKYLSAVIYAKIALPEACLEGEDPRLGIPLKIEIINGEHVSFVGRNPFFHQRPPYLVGKYILPNADEFYGQGIPHAIQYMQYEVNSKAEQAMDSATLALNPVAFIDPALAAQTNNFEIEPGAIWYVNPNAAKFSAMPDLSGTGYQAIQLLRQQMQAYSDLAPALPPQFQGKSRTATQSEIIDRAVGIDNKTFQLQNELMVLNPLMEMWESLTDQHAKEDQIIMVLGRRSSDWKRILISRDAMIGKYRYYWKASSDLASKQIKARQIIDMMKVAGSLPPEAQAQLKMNYAEIVKMLWSEMFQLPDADKILGAAEEMNSQDPEVCYKMLKLGMEVEVLPADDDKGHIVYLSEKLKSEKDDWVKAELTRLILLHDVQRQKKELMAKMQQEQMRAALVAQAQAQAEPAASGGSGTQGSGNRTQLSPNSNAGNMGSGVRA